MEINNNNMENPREADQGNNQQQISHEEEIGIHKGALNTLISERNELIKMIANVESIMQAHIARLSELGIEIRVQKPNEEQGKANQ